MWVASLFFYYVNILLRVFSLIFGSHLWVESFRSHLGLLLHCYLPQTQYFRCETLNDLTSEKVYSWAFTGLKRVLFLREMANMDGTSDPRFILAPSSLLILYLIILLWWCSGYAWRMCFRLQCTTSSGHYWYWHFIIHLLLHAHVTGNV